MLNINVNINVNINIIINVKNIKKYQFFIKFSRFYSIILNIKIKTIINYTILDNT